MAIRKYKKSLQRIDISYLSSIIKSLGQAVEIKLANYLQSIKTIAMSLNADITITYC
jgi:hypothetical protein